jgi:aspartyl aminopeptidase
VDEATLNDTLMGFIGASPTPFHACANAAQVLRGAGFRPLHLRDAWALEPGAGYYVTANDSSMVAFRAGADVAARGMLMVGAHTDSPTLRVKPRPLSSAAGCLRAGIEVYGGVLLNPWFDRDLSLAGRVHYRDGTGRLAACLVDFRRAVAALPSLAIHLDRDANRNRSVNPQTDTQPLLLQGEADFAALLAAQVRSEHGIAVADIVEFELCFYDVQPPALTGFHGEFLAAARLDNLLSCHVALQVLCAAPAAQPMLVVLNDHEEVGSGSTAGAQGPLLEQTLQRLCGDGEAFSRTVARSLLVSTDNAHAVHPNYADRHDAAHGPLLNGGPVVKVNATQRYASSGETQAIFRDAARRADVPLQVFTMRADIACGSTIGPLTATRIGVRTVDVGVAQLAMHSIRELCGARDPHRLYRVLLELARGGLD